MKTKNMDMSVPKTITKFFSNPFRLIVWNILIIVPIIATLYISLISYLFPPMIGSPLESWWGNIVVVLDLVCNLILLFYFGFPFDVFRLIIVGNLTIFPADFFQAAICFLFYGLVAFALSAFIPDYQDNIEEHFPRIMKIIRGTTIFLLSVATIVLLGWVCVYALSFLFPTIWLAEKRFALNMIFALMCAVWSAGFLFVFVPKNWKIFFPLPILVVFLLTKAAAATIFQRNNILTSMARNYCNQGNSTHAGYSFASAIEFYPDCAEAQVNRRRIEKFIGPDAKLLPDSTYYSTYSYQTLKNYATVLADIQKGKNRINGEIDHSTKTIGLDPTDANAYYERANAYVSRAGTSSDKDNIDKAIADYTKAIELNPNYVNAYSGRGNAYRRQGNFIQAIADFTRVIELKPNSMVGYNARAMTYDKQGDYTQAIADYTKIIAFNPSFGSIYFWRAHSYYLVKDYVNAWLDIRKAEELKFKVPADFLEKLKKDSGRDK